MVLQRRVLELRVQGLSERAIAERLAQPWRKRLGALPTPADGWYR